MECTWSSLIEKAKNNDQDAFGTLYQSSYEIVYKTVKSRINDIDAVFDIVQDAFMKAFDSLSLLDNPDHFLPWIKRIAVNKAKDWCKKRHDVLFSQISDDNDIEPDFEDDRLENSPEAVVERNEIACLVEKVLRSLPNKQYTVINMFYYQGMSLAEIAEASGINGNTVKSRFKYGRKKIKTSFEELVEKGILLYS